MKNLKKILYGLETICLCLCKSFDLIHNLKSCSRQNILTIVLSFKQITYTISIEIASLLLLHHHRYSG